MHTSGRVSVVLNIVDGRDGHVQLDVGSRVNDGQWHRVEIKRNRMETTLLVDADTDSKFAFGSDFNFGDLSRNSEVRSEICVMVSGDLDPPVSWFLILRREGAKTSSSFLMMSEVLFFRLENEKRIKLKV